MSVVEPGCGSLSLFLFLLSCAGCVSYSDVCVRVSVSVTHAVLFLFSLQGCSIGCDFCMTDPKHPDNNGSIPTKPITGNPPHADKAGFRKSYVLPLTFIETPYRFELS